MEQSTDIRTMTFMRWNLPPMGSLYSAFPDRNLADLSGKYVSFQNYHMIEISSCLQGPRGYEKATMFEDAYNRISQKRSDLSFEWHDGRRHSAQSFSDFYIQQSLPIFGNEKSFWDTEPDILYITMIQLEPSKRIPSLRSMKETILKDIPFEDKLSVYFTTDYCDMVLFGRDMPCGDYQKALWKLIFDRSNAVRDTITFSCFSLRYYMDQTRTIRKMGEDELLGVCAQTGDINISVDISIKNEDVWQGLKSRIQKIKSAIVNQISGRNDVRISLRDISRQQVYYILSCLDQACEKGGIDIYEVIPRFALGAEEGDNHRQRNNNAGILSALGRLHSEFLASADKIYDKEQGGDKGLHQQIVFSAEVYHALYSMSINGFADEFVLSVFPSLVEYTHLYRFLAGVWQQPESLLGKECFRGDVEIAQWRKEIEAMLEDIHREYIQSLSTLVQCTVHGERQFVQVPALNSPIFNVPPKLLALYSCMVSLITDLLNDSKCRSFSFIIVPDFRDDIYVSQISKCIEEVGADRGHPYNLLRINLNESLFYKPVTLLSVLCHEIAHHVGGESRKRKLRAECFMRTVAMFIVGYSLPLVKVKGAESRGLPEKLAEIIGDELLRHYDETETGGMQYFLADIQEYIIDKDAVRRLFQIPQWREEIKSAVRNGIRDYYKNGGPTSKDELADIAAIQEKAISSNYISTMYHREDTVDAALCMIADNIVVKIAGMVEEWFFGETTRWRALFTRVCDDCLSAFGEAYSDKRMIELLGIDDSEDYNILLEGYFGPKSTKIINLLRWNSVRQAVWGIESDITNENMPDADPIMVNYAAYSEKQICEYLKACGLKFEQRKESQKLRKLVRVLKSNDSDKVFAEIDKLLKGFKRSIREV